MSVALARTHRAIRPSYPVSVGASLVWWKTDALQLPASAREREAPLLHRIKYLSGQTAHPGLGRYVCGKGVHGRAARCGADTGRGRPGTGLITAGDTDPGAQRGEPRGSGLADTPAFSDQNAGWPPSAPFSRCPPSAPRGHVTPDRTRRVRQSRMPRVPAAAAGCRAGVAVCRSGHLSVGVSPDAGPRVPYWPRSSGHARPPASAVRGSRRTAVGLSLAGLSLVRPVPVVRSSLAESRQRRPLLAAGVTLGVHMSGMSRPGPAGYPIVRDR